MIRAANPPPPEPPKPPTPPDKPVGWHDEEDVGNLRVAIHKKNKQWDLLVVVTTEQLRQIMRPNGLLTHLVDSVPGFGEVPPMCLSFMSAKTRAQLTPRQVILETVIANSKAAFVAIFPVVINLENANALRRRKMVAMACEDPVLKASSLAAWSRMDNLVLLLANTKTEVSRSLETFRRAPNIQVRETNSDDESMW